MLVVAIASGILAAAAALVFGRYMDKHIRTGLHLLLTVAFACTLTLGIVIGIVTIFYDGLGWR